MNSSAASPPRPRCGRVGARISCAESAFSPTKGRFGSHAKITRNIRREKGPPYAHRLSSPTRTCRRGSRQNESTSLCCLPPLPRSSSEIFWSRLTYSRRSRFRSPGVLDQKVQARPQRQPQSLSNCGKGVRSDGKSTCVRPRSHLSFLVFLGGRCSCPCVWP